MDVDKARLEKLEKLREQVRIGGKGTARRKRKVVHKNTAADNTKFQAALKKLHLNPIPGIEEVMMHKSDGTVMHFKNPKVQASIQANIFAVTGQGEVKEVKDIFPDLFTQIEATKQKLANAADAGKAVAESKADDADDMPELTEDFDEKSRME